MTTGDRLRPFAIRRIGLLDPPRSAAAGIKDPRQRSRALDPRPGGVGQIWTKASRRDSTTYIYRPKTRLSNRVRAWPPSRSATTRRSRRSRGLGHSRDLIPGVPRHLESPGTTPAPPTYLTE